MKCRRLAVLTLLALFSFSLFGCGKKHVLDGPGMVNDQPWKAFTLSRSDSESQYNFWFTVEQGDFAFLLTGECRGEDGEMYAIENGVELSTKDLQYLRDLHLHDLSDVIEDDAVDDLMILDAPMISLVLTFRDGNEQEKNLSADTSIEIYQRLLPYFENA